MDGILNFNAPINIDLLDRVCDCSVNGTPEEVAEANRVLSEFKNHEAAWQAVDTILESTSRQYTQYFALSVLEPVIQFKWRALGAEQRDGIKNYIVEKVVKFSQSEELIKSHDLVLEKMNVILVECSPAHGTKIIKQEWPRNWGSFVEEIVTSSRTNETLCQNNMVILKMLSQEIFDFSRGNLTRAKTQELKATFQEQFLGIFELCQFVLTQSNRPSLIIVTLDTLSCFLSWIPAGYVFQFDLVPMLIQKYLPVEPARNGVMRCLIEIATIEVGDVSNYSILLNMFIQCLMSFLPVETDIAQAVESGSEDDMEFILNVALFLVNFFKVHRESLECEENAQVLSIAHMYLANISLVDHEETFKICLEYWGILVDFADKLQAKALFFEVKPSLGSGLMLNSSAHSARKQLYAPALQTVRIAMVSRMARPEEVLVTEDENGNLIREHLKDTESIIMYQSMRETLVYLTHLDPANTIEIMERRLAEQRVLVAQHAPKDMWWNPLNRICWAVGSTSGVQSEEREKKFLVNVIKDLLAMCEDAKGKDNKAVIATNIMYVVGQYPRFLNDHWKFLRTVVNKLFEFMREEFPGVQDMACDTFLKISRSCRRRFVLVQLGEHRPYIIDILQRLPAIISVLQPTQIQSVYESVGYMISSSSSNKEQLIRELMSLPNQKWMEIMEEAKSSNGMALQDMDTARVLVNILKTNNRAAVSLGDAYVSQLAGFFNDLMLVYRTYSDAISHGVASEGPKIMRTAVVKSWRGVKQQILKLMAVFIEKCTEDALLQQKFLPPMLDAVLANYQENHPLARDAEVLALLTVIMNRLEGGIAPLIPRIFDTVFECTVMMIRENYNDFPQVRSEFFNFLRAVNQHCFPVKHTRPDIAEIGLNMLHEFWQNVCKSDAANAFFQTYVTKLIDRLLYVLVDTFHKPGFKMQATILRGIFMAVEMNHIQVPVFDTSAHSYGSNKEYLLHFIADLISKAFTNLSAGVIQQFVTGLFVHCNDLSAFKNHLRDFLVQTKKFGDEDNTDLYLEEQEEQRQAIEQERRAIPGMVKADDSMTG